MKHSDKNTTAQAPRKQPTIKRLTIDEIRAFKRASKLRRDPS